MSEQTSSTRTGGPHRLVLGLVSVVTLCVVLFVALMAALSMGLAVCGGDAGEAYASPGSAAGRFCTSTVGDAVIGATFVVPPLLWCALAIGGLVRRSWAWTAASGWLPLALVFLTSAVVWGLPDSA